MIASSNINGRFGEARRERGRGRRPSPASAYGRPGRRSARPAAHGRATRRPPAGRFRTAGSSADGAQAAARRRRRGAAAYRRPRGAVAPERRTAGHADARPARIGDPRSAARRRPRDVPIGTAKPPQRPDRRAAAPPIDRPPALRHTISRPPPVMRILVCGKRSVIAADSI